ncbi:MAG: aminopeptidase P family protein [Candidatus Levybacteria bacterium]|nr:aminopeptidase P family protein [Candidatus Levybacteria bacterium]
MKDRLDRLKSIITKNNLDAIVISSVPNIIYLTGYSGFSYFEREAFLIITSRENFLLTDGRYSEAVSKVPGFNLLEISNSNSLDDVLKILSKKIKRIGLEEDDVTLSEGKRFKKYFKLHPAKDLVSLRTVKSEDEIKKIKIACRIGDETFSFILGKIKQGISEKEVAHQVEMFVKEKGADLSFPSIVAFGKNSSIPHYQTGNEKLRINNMVLLDFGVRVDNYCSDMTRTIFFGKADKKIKEIYNTVSTSQQLTIKQLNNLLIDKKTFEASFIDSIARNHIVKQGFPTIPHSLGHGVGIEVHEPPRLSPRSNEILKNGMVFSIEPGIYLPNIGGVRIEDLVFIRDNKIELLTHSPKDLIEI